ncbi:hypothetical protein ACFE04_029366 [Oxalis oulophora]
MEIKVQEALKAKVSAEKRFAKRDFLGAKNYALKAKALCPGLEGVSQMVSTFDVYIASETTYNGEIDYFSVLGLKPFADKDAVKKQYRKMAVLLHPDKNKTVGADGAFKLVSEAWAILSDRIKKSSRENNMRHKQNAPGVVLTNLYPTGVSNYNFPISPHTTRHDTFWTVCTSCRVQYEYLRKYINKKLSCKNCRGTFIAVETGTTPVSFSYHPSSHMPNNGYGSHVYDLGVTYLPSNGTILTENGVPSYHNSHSPHGYEYVSNMSFQWNPHSGTSTGIVSPNGVSNKCGNGGLKVISRAYGKNSMKNDVANMNSYVSSDCNGTREVQLDKRRKVSFGSGTDEGGVLKPAVEDYMTNGSANYEQRPKFTVSGELQTRRCSAAPAFDARKLLIDKAKTEIRKKLGDMKLEFIKKEKELANTIKVVEPKIPVSITVPDPDFHDFDKYRSEESFKPKQIWAIYDEDDGMPRLYCSIRQVVSLNPFKLLITYLNSKTDSEFGSINWIDSGFTKSCGHFRASVSDYVDQVNIFSHLLREAKASRGGCVRIFPKNGEIWALYRNWSADWDRSTPDKVRHEYEMVEVLDDYSEELGVCITPLLKLSGFNTVYQRNTDRSAVRWISRREMFRFSHQVPSWFLSGEATELPENCWDLDPAATPDQLLLSLPAQVKD